MPHEPNRPNFTLYRQSGSDRKHKAFRTRSSFESGSSFSILGTRRATPRISYFEPLIRKEIVGREVGFVAQNPTLKEKLARIADDEAHHAELAWRIVHWAIREGGHRCADAVARAFTIEIAKACAPRGRMDSALDTAILHAHGRLAAAEELALMRLAARDVIEPCAAALTPKRHWYPRPAALAIADGKRFDAWIDTPLRRQGGSSATRRDRLDALPWAARSRHISVWRSPARGDRAKPDAVRRSGWNVLSTTAIRPAWLTELLH